MATMAMAGQELESMQAGRMDPAAGVVRRNRDLYEKQLSRRRGPTPEMFFTKHLDNSRIVKADDQERRAEMRRFTMVMSLFFCLTMTYVWQHFSAVETGYRIEDMKTKVEQARETNRQLLLSEAQLSEPSRIDVIAKQLGLAEPLPGQVVRPDGAAQAGQPVLAQVHAPVLATN